MNNIKKGLLLLLYNVRYYCILLFRILPAIIVIITPYISMLAVVDAYKLRGYFVFGSEWLIPLILYILAALGHYINKAGNDDIDGCPVARKRFTKRGQNGEVIFNISDVYEMVEYLAEVEEYCEQYGKYREVKHEVNK